MRLPKEAVLFGTAAIVGTAATVAAATVTSVRVSSVSPFPSGSCDFGLTTNFANSEVEPMVAVNPANPNNIIDVWQQDRWGAPTSGGAYGSVSATSLNGGATFTRATVPFSLCAGGTSAGLGDYQRATDSWATFGPTGVAYQTALAFDWTQNRSMIAVSRSPDGGLTWGPLRQVSKINKGSFNTVDDKETITADPTNANNVYAVWIRYVTPPASFKPDGSGAHTQKGNAMFSRSLDQGQTWSDPVPIAKSDEAQANQIVVLDDGTLLDFFNDLTFTNKGEVASYNVSYVKSGDHGATWSAKIPITSIPSAGTFAPDAANPNTSRVRSGQLIDVAARGQTIYVVYPLEQAAPDTPDYDRVAMVHSGNGGASWSPPVLVGGTPTAGDWRTRQQFTPIVEISADGHVAVTYYDFRFDTDTNAAPASTDYWIDILDANGTLVNETRLTSPSSFDLAGAPRTSATRKGYFLGDYQGLAAAGNTFISTFAVATTDPGNPTDIWTARITP
jgi:hypothetical protein